MKNAQEARRSRPRAARKRHALHRHDPQAEPRANPPPPHACWLVRHIVSLESLGWRVVELRPLISEGEVALWHVRISRVDLGATMTVSAAAPDIALAELVRYASADAMTAA